MVRKNGEFKITEKISNMVIPYTISDVLMARIDRLDEKTRDLIKVASVIGRSFFYRILTEVAKTVDRVDVRLSYLKNIELIRERRRMQELEYLFKHALAQEATYESILQQKRKGLHLQVAQSIEKVFNERLNEFYGMLAYHYSQAEDLDKAEEFLIKAGEEALKASASREALHYCRQALELYLKKYGEKANPENVAMLEKSIAMALFNTGNHAKAINYFDKVLTFYGEATPKHPIAIALKFASGFFAFIISIYFPFLKWGKNPTQQDKETINLFYIKLQALGNIDPQQFFIQSFWWVKRVSKFDITKIENGTLYVASMSAIFSWTGLSFALSRKIFEFVKGKINIRDVKLVFFHKFLESILNTASGNWPEKIEFDNHLMDQNLKIGEFLSTSCYSAWNALLCIARGDFIEAQSAYQKLSEISDVYNNDFAKAHKYFVKTSLLMKFRNPQEALNEVEKGIQFLGKTGFQVWLIYLYAIKARILLLLGNVSGSEEALRQANSVKADTMAVPLHIGEFVVSRFILDLFKLENALYQTEKTSILRTNACKNGKEALKIANRLAPIKTETLKLMGTYYWIIMKQRKAVHWWRKAIQKGVHLNDRLELSRTYFEIGKRLQEPRSKCRELDGIKPKEYLAKARKMFVEMDLQWDLDELDKVMAAR